MALINPPSFEQAGSYDAQQTRLPFSTFLNSGGGVVGSGDLAVTALSTPNMSVNVAAGQVWIPGTFSGYSYQGQYYCLNDATINVLIPGSDPTYPRIDLIVAQVLDAAYGSASSEWQIVDIEGTASSSPVIPTAPASSIVLAQIAVGAAVSTITSSNITDERTFMGMTVPDKGAQVFNVKAYGATGNGTTDDTAAIQGAANAAANAILLFPPSSNPYLIASSIDFTADITVIAYGATLKIEGYLYNSVPINLKWYGGTVTDAGATQAQYPFQFGAGPGSSSVNLISCVAKDILWENVNHGAWLCQYVNSTGTTYNTDIHWDNLRCIKASTAGAADGFQLVGKRVYARVIIDDGGTSGFGITSAWLYDAEWHVIATGAGPRKAIALQPYTGNGPFPTFGNIDIYSNGSILLNNGNLTAATVVSEEIRIYPQDAITVQVGNSPYDIWDSTIIKGSLRPPSTGGTFAICVFNSITADLVIDWSDVPNTLNDASGCIYITGSAGSGYLRFNNLTIRNVLAGATPNLIMVASSSLVKYTRILAGDLTDNVGVSLISAADLQYLYGGGSGNAWISNLIGYNPTGPQTAPAVPASGITQINPFPFDTNVYISGGTVTAIASGNIATPSGLALSTATTGGSLAASTSYSYQVTAVNQRGETLASAVVSLTTGSTTSTNTITATWQTVTGATSYNIYGRVSGSIAKIANVTTTSYTDTGSVTPSGALPTSDTTGITTGLTAGSIFVPVGEGLQITYSAVPTWVWIGN